MTASVIHPKAITVFEHAVINASAAFPGLIVFHRNFLWHRMLESKIGFSGDAVNQCAINKQFPPRTNLMDLMDILTSNRRREQ
jgi:hypothetical protein